jgi:hypothetical protein
MKAERARRKFAAYRVLVLCSSASPRKHNNDSALHEPAYDNRNEKRCNKLKASHISDSGLSGKQAEDELDIVGGQQQKNE